jgi:hypothetical protein
MKKPLLINSENPMPSSYCPELCEISDNYFLEKHACHAMKNMLRKAESDGIKICIFSAYRSTAYQQKLFDDEVRIYTEQGYSDKEAFELASRAVALPYTSEHNSGLAADLSSSCTGYQTIKWVMSAKANGGDSDRVDRSTSDLPVYRLGEILLIYAEAKAELGTINQDDLNNSINLLRKRVGMPSLTMDVDADPYMTNPATGYTNSKLLASSKLALILEIRRERAVELMFKGHRFNDLQRWMLLTVYPYNIKTSQEFDRVYPSEWYTSGENDPRDAQVAGWHEEVILERVFGAKHYWFPLPDDEVYLYEEFAQNPGW